MIKVTEFNSDKPVTFENVFNRNDLDEDCTFEIFCDVCGEPIAYDETIVLSGGGTVCCCSCAQNENIRLHGYPLYVAPDTQAIWVYENWKINECLVKILLEQGEFTHFNGEVES